MIRHRPAAINPARPPSENGRLPPPVAVIRIRAGVPVQNFAFMPTKKPRPSPGMKAAWFACA
jgi:hypothetical protein